MPATPDIPDKTYHPLDPSKTFAETTPLSRIAVAGATTYTTGYWDDFKATVGFDNKRMSERDRLIYEDAVAGSFLERNISSGLGAGRVAGTIGAYSLGSMIAPGMVGGMVVGTALDTAFGAVWNASGLGKIQKHFEAKNFAEGMGQLLARGTGNTLSGHGFSGDEVREFEKFTNDAAARFNVNVEDIQGEMVKYANKGLFDNTRNIDEFKKQFGQLKKNVKEIVKVLGTSQDEAIDLMSELTSRGIAGKSVSAGMATAQALSRRTGISATTFIGAGVSGAEAFQGTGLSAVAGFQLGMTNRGAIEAGMMTGKISSADIWQLGGADNAAFAMTQQQTDYLNTGQANILLRGAMTKSGKLDMSKMYDLAKSGFGEQLNTAYNNMSGMGYLTFVGSQDDLKSELMKQGGDVMNAQLMNSVIEAASLSGFNTDKMNLTQLKGFAMSSGLVKNGAMFDSIAESLMAAKPQGTTTERELARRSREGKRRAFVREAGFIHGLTTGRPYVLGKMGDAISAPFDELSGNLIMGVDNTIETFNNWYREKTQGVVNYEVTKDDMKTVGQVFASGRLSGLSNLKMDSGVFKDFSLDKDIGEVATAAIRKGLVKLDDVKGSSLSDAYLSNTKILKEKGLFNPMATAGEMIKSLQSLPEYENASFFQDAGLFHMGAGGYTVVDSKLFNEEVNRANKVITLAKTVGSDPKKREKILTEITTQGGLSMSIDEIKQKISVGMESQGDDFKKASPEEQLDKIVGFVGLSKKDILKAGEPSRVMSTILVAAENVGVDFQTSGLENFKLGINTQQLKENLKAGEEGFNNFIDGLDDKVGGWLFGISSDAEEYLGKGHTQSLLNDLVNARSKGDTKQIEEITNKIITGAPQKIKQSLGSWLSGDKQKAFFEKADEFFKPQEGETMSAYEKLASSKVSVSTVEDAFSDYAGGSGVFADYYKNASSGGTSFFSDVEKGRGASIEDIAKSIGGGAEAMLTRFSKDGLTSRERGKIGARLLGGGSIRDRMMAYATMDRADLAGVDEKITKGVEDNIRRQAVQRGFISEEASKGMDDKALRDTALLLVGKAETGQRSAGGADVVNAKTQSEIDLATQMTISLRTLTSILTEMQNKQK